MATSAYAGCGSVARCARISCFTTTIYKVLPKKSILARVLNSFENSCACAKRRAAAGGPLCARLAQVASQCRYATKRSWRDAPGFAPWGCARAEGHTQRRACILKGVYEVNHLARVRTVYRPTHEDRTKTRPSELCERCGPFSARTQGNMAQFGAFRLFHYNVAL